MRTKKAEQIAAFEGEMGMVGGRSSSVWDRLRRAIGLSVEDLTGTGQQDIMRLVTGDSTGSESGLFDSSGRASKSRPKKDKSRRKQARASRRQNRR